MILNKMKLANSHKLTSQFNPTLQHGLQLFLKTYFENLWKKFGTFMTIYFEKIYGKFLKIFGKLRKNIWKFWEKKFGKIL